MSEIQSVRLFRDVLGLRFCFEWVQVPCKGVFSNLESRYCKYACRVTLGDYRLRFNLNHPGMLHDYSLGIPNYTLPEKYYHGDLQHTTICLTFSDDIQNHSSSSPIYPIHQYGETLFCRRELVLAACATAPEIFVECK